jgi:hypothetical protein
MESRWRQSRIPAFQFLKFGHRIVIHDDADPLETCGTQGRRDREGLVQGCGEFGAFCFSTEFSTCEVNGGVNAKGLRSLFLLDMMQTSTISFFHLLNRKNPAAKISDLGKFLLDCQ